MGDLISSNVGSQPKIDLTSGRVPSRVPRGEDGPSEAELIAKTSTKYGGSPVPPAAAGIERGGMIKTVFQNRFGRLVRTAVAQVPFGMSGKQFTIELTIGRDGKLDLSQVKVTSGNGETSKADCDRVKGMVSNFLRLNPQALCSGTLSQEYTFEMSFTIRE